MIGRERERVEDMMPRWFATLLMVVPGAVLAHHSFAMFDMNKDLTLTGTVREFQWQSPHSWLDIMVKDRSGKVGQWSLEMGAPNTLYRRGWRQRSVSPGDQVTAVLHPLRDGRQGGSLVSLILPGGTQLFGSGGSAAPAPPQGSAP
jgi:hypothetical protein